MGKTVEYYMSLPYTIELKRDPEEGWFIRVRELQGCVSQGDTAEEAVMMIREAMQVWLEVALEEGDAIPEPRPEEEYSGKFVVRVPRSLHRELVATADREGVSLNQFINVALAEAVGRHRVTSAAPSVAKRQGQAAHNPKRKMARLMPAEQDVTQVTAGANRSRVPMLQEPREDYSSDSAQQVGEAGPETRHEEAFMLTGPKLGSPGSSGPS